MPNIYVFWSGSGDPPSPWVKVTTYDGRYVRCDSNASNALGTGGSSSHTHSASGSTSYASRNASSYNSTYGITGHSHTVSNVSVSTVNNDPSYYTLSLIRMDLTTWREIRSFPQGAIVASYSSINTGQYTDWEVFTSANGYLIKLGSPGSAGGGSSHNHSVSGSLSGGSSYLSDGGSGTTIAGGGSHTHTYSGNSNDGTLLPYSVYTRFYRAKNDVIYTPVNVVCFFDGAPTSEWTVITGWNDAILGANDTNPATSGSNTHTHSYSGTSSSYGGSLSNKTGNSTFVPPSHTHTITITLDSASHVPPYVNLIPAYLNTEQSAWNTRTCTYPVDVLVKKTLGASKVDDVVISKTFNTSSTSNATIKLINNLTYVDNILIQKTLSHELPSVDALAIKEFNKYVDNDVITSKTFKKDISLNSLIQAAKNLTYINNILLQDTKLYEFVSDILLSRMFDCTYIQNALNQRSYDGLYGNAIRIWTRPPISISGSELLISEGDMYAELLLRMAYNINWTLVHWRYIDYFADLLLLRLDINISYDMDIITQKAFDGIIDAYSTIKRIGEISYDIDTLINRLDIDVELLGGVFIETTFDLSGGIDTYLLRAYDAPFAIGTRIWTRAPFRLSGDYLNISTGDLILEMMLRREYAIDWQLVYRRYISAYVNSLIRRDDIDVLYNLGHFLQTTFDTRSDSDLILERAYDADYDNDLLLQKKYDQYLAIGSLINRLDIDTIFSIDLILKRAFSSEYDSNILLQKVFDRYLELDSLINRFDIAAGYDIDLALEKEFGIQYDGNALVQKEFDEYAGIIGSIKLIQDISSSIKSLLIRYDINKEFDAQTTLKNIYHSPYGSSAVFQASFTAPFAISTRIWTRPPFSLSGTVLDIATGNIYIEMLLRAIYESKLQLALRRHSQAVFDVLVNRLDIGTSYDEDLLLQTSFTDTYNANIITQKEFDRLISLYTTIKWIRDRTLNINSLIKRFNIDISAFTHAYVLKVFDSSFTSSEYLLKTFDIDYIYKTVIEKRGIPHIYNSIVSIKHIFDASYDINLLQRKAYDLLESSDTVLKAINKASAELDMLLNRLGIDVGFDLDMVLERTFHSNADIDVFMLKSLDAYSAFNNTVKRIQDILHAVDMLLIRFGICADYVHDMYLQKEFERDYDSHLYAIKELSRSAESDALVELRNVDRSGHIDSLIETTFAAEHDLDMLLQISFDISMALSSSVKIILEAMLGLGAYIEIRDVPKSYVAAGTLKIVPDISFSIDALVEKMFEMSSSINATIKRIQEVESSIDMLLIRKDIPVDVASKMLLQKGFDCSNPTLSTIKIIREVYDQMIALIKIIQDAVYDADTVIKRVFDKSLPSDMLLRRDSIDVEYDFDMLLEGTQSLSYYKSVLIEKMFTSSYDFGAMLDKTIDTSYDIFTYLLVKYQKSVIYDTYISNIFDSRYNNIARFRKYTVAVRGKSRIQTSMAPYKSRAFITVNADSKLIRNSKAEFDGMWP